MRREALPKMIKVAEAPELKRALEHHQDETEGQIKRLDQIFEQLHMPARDETCEAVMGIISEGNDVIQKGRNPQVIDAGRPRPWQSSITKSLATVR